MFRPEVRDMGRLKRCDRSAELSHRSRGSTNPFVDESPFVDSVVYYLAQRQHVMHGQTPKMSQ